MWILWALLSVFCWALVNVLDSTIVHRFHRNPLVLQYSQTLVSLPLLGILSFFLPLQTSWVWPLLFAGILGYAGDLWFFHVLGHLDVSVSNLAWAILSLLLASAGLLLFQESWGSLQTAGAVLILGGTLMLCSFHQGVSVQRAASLILILGFLYLPFYVMKKYAIDVGVAPATTFFWMTLGREISSFSVPLSVGFVRREALRTILSMPLFMIFNAAIIVCFLFAEYTGALAYSSGPLSLVAVIGNLQFFMVIALAWLLWRLWPRYAAKELLTHQSITVKLGSFILVFLGLALLGSSSL